MNANVRTSAGRKGSAASAAKGGAERTCVGCQKTGEKAQLIRLVCDPLGQVRLDIHGKLPGRGAYLCAQRLCVEHAMKKARLQETFRRAVTLAPVDELVRAMARVMEERALGCIRIARKAGRVVSGYARVSRAVIDEPVACLLVAEDTTPERRRAYQGWCAKRRIPCRSFLTKARLGELAGRDECSALGILDPRLGEHLLGYLEGMSRLTEP